ncbi:unnamed protein product [Mycena citricolor]|uniref:Uncharacterized protein n=1 Tax=Mycena citricolor TaxID=2018698 RepID=A0AAD2H6A2_9AGAR|nr:unnamed protein product [Mycena citricolor]
MVPTEFTFLDESIGLWSMSEECSPPSQLPFAYTLPASFKAGSLDRPLPPSYSSPQSSIAYTLQVTITRRRTRKFFGSPKNTVCIPFGYRPRTRPGHSTQSFVAGFLQDVKTMPEEWREHAHRVTGKAKGDVKPLDLQLYIPSSGVFALDESIPFHVQLTGAVSSLQEVYRADVQKGQRLVEVKIVRQTLVTINGMRTAVLQSVIGRADLVSLPPGAGAEDNEVDGSASLDWSGDLRVNGDVEVASFDAGIVRMQVGVPLPIESVSHRMILNQLQDFIVVELGPSANFERVRHSHSIRLVTDAWDT